MRPTIDEYFLSIAEVVSMRSTCIRRHVGAAIVRDKHIIATGYNGAPRNLKHCAEVGCIRDQENIESGMMHEVCRSVHAEQNSIIQAALYGVSTKGSTIYCTHQPCVLCAKMIINANIIRVVFVHSYPDIRAFEFLKEAGVEIEQILHITRYQS